MALLKYFNHVSGTVLPNPESPLNRVVDQKAIEAANEEVMKITKTVSETQLKYFSNAM